MVGKGKGKGKGKAKGMQGTAKGDAKGRPSHQVGQHQQQQLHQQRPGRWRSGNGLPHHWKTAQSSGKSKGGKPCDDEDEDMIDNDEDDLKFDISTTPGEHLDIESDQIEKVFKWLKAKGISDGALGEGGAQ